jgi:thiol-disulfide isomerase/thioredoxin
MRSKVITMLNKALILFSILLIWQTTNAQKKKVNKIQVVNFDKLEPYLHQNNDTIYLVNFWATWCAPCIKELPAIEAVEEKHSDKKFKVLLVSLDFPKELSSRLEPFVKSKNITSEVFLLNDPNQNRWINLVDANWSGEIPFTILYGRKFRESYTQPFTFEELDSIINLKLNLP